MKMIVKRRQVLIAALVVALGAAVFVNWYSTRPSKKDVDSNTNLGDAQYVNADASEVATNAQQEYFSESKINRSQAHAEAQLLLENIIKDSAATEQAKQTATQELANLAKLIKSEVDIENIIKAKINNDCLVVLDGQTAQIIVAQGALNDAVTIQIKEIILSQIKISVENIIIFEAK